MTRITPLVLLLGLSVSAPVSAEIYRYQDVSGKWQYSDVKPDSSPDLVELELPSLNTMSSVDSTTEPVVDVPVDLCPSDTQRRSNYYQRRKAAMGTKGAFDLEHKEQTGRNVLVANNSYFAPISVKVGVSSRYGVRTKPSLPRVIEVPAHSKKTIVEFGPVKKDRPWPYRYSYDTQLGKLNARQDRDCYYLPPVPAGASFRVTQSFNGRFSHQQGGSQFAVDIAMDVGTPIVAARDGVVITREEGYTLSGTSERFLRRANAVRILHGDGTVAVYAHLQFKTLRLYEGEQVRAGQVIGKSGNTGYSTGPHLHFAIGSNQNMAWQSVPFQFLLEGKPHTPKRGDMLTNSKPR